MKGKLLFLGTGGSVGVPVIGCSCAVCQSKDEKNQRLRPSVLLRLMNRQFLVDVGPDFRQQALRYGIHHLDGVYLTHAHHDHAAGIDDLRPICFERKSPLPILLSHETAHEVTQRYAYLFQPQDQGESRFVLHMLPDESGEIQFEGFSVGYVSYQQGKMGVNGYRWGDLAYLSDIRQYDPSIFTHLQGVKDLVISALRFTPSPLHFSIDEAIDFSKAIKAERVWLTHLSHELEHHQANAYLPANMRVAYDGLELDLLHS